MTTRSRLSPAVRRAALLDVGAELFATRPYDEVWVDEVARIAGVSRGLLYHYFPGKKAFFVAVVRRVADELLACTAPDPDQPALDQLRTGLDAYLEYAWAHAHGYRAIHCGALSTHTEVRQVIAANLAEQRRRIIDALGLPAPAPPHLELALSGWLAFLVATCLDWLDTADTGRVVEQRDVREMCVHTLAAALASALGPEAPLPPLT